MGSSSGTDHDAGKSADSMGHSDPSEDIHTRSIRTEFRSYFSLLQNVEDQHPIVFERDADISELTRGKHTYVPERCVKLALTSTIDIRRSSWGEYPVSSDIDIRQKSRLSSWDEYPDSSDIDIRY
ncbi:hypothetical protein DPMN_057536 [Dreissena polymorpha]|uniref:Uncharacterized protein n=1 Tax=Dreissena polymorpha TaxID=45954 RepID=A0A9D4C0B9_DREPO|nr:hypothetical protein DPMN_057536 [Dreissena polymorpha]